MSCSATGDTSASGRNAPKRESPRTSSPTSLQSELFEGVDALLTDQRSPALLGGLAGGDRNRLDGFAAFSKKYKASAPVTLLAATWAAEQDKDASAREVAEWLGLDPRADGLVSWDVYDAVLSLGDVILMMSWRDYDAALAFEKTPIPDGARLRRVRVVRDYGMYDRRETRSTTRTSSRAHSAPTDRLC